MAMIDWAFTEDGDLALGEPMVNEQGEILYQHLDGTIDTEIREDGVEMRDIGLVEDLEAERQIIMNRLRTDAPDWYHHPAMGGNLTDLIGEPNTRQTGTKGAELIHRALTYKGLYHSQQIKVRPVPLNPETILFLIEIIRYNNAGVIRLPVTFDLTHGLMDIYEVPKSSE